MNITRRIDAGNSLLPTQTGDGHGDKKNRSKSIAQGKQNFK
jgi:hypothetical protein